MEDLFSHFTGKLYEYIEFGYMFAFVFAALALKLSGVFEVVAQKFCTTWLNPNKYLVFVIALLLGVVWRIVYDTDIAKLIVSFGVGTSFYDLFLEDAIKYIKRKLSSPEEPTV